MARVIKKRTFGGAPAVDFLDLSYFMPIMTASALNNSPDFPFKYGRPLKTAAAVLQRMGRAPRWYIYEKFVTALMANQYEAEDVKSEVFARWVAKLYEGRRYPFIVIGPTLGSLVYLSALLDAPFLPMNYSLAIRHPKMHPDHMKDHIEVAAKRADYFLKQDPNVEIIHEYDPIHQRFRLRNASLLRFRMMNLPDAYKKFIRTHLEHDGSIIFVESRIGWRQYEIGRRFYHQVGSPGGIPADEYIGGSKRIEKFLHGFMQDNTAYRLPRGTELLPESHYGVTPGNRLDVIRTAHALKRSFSLLFTDDVYQLNRLVSELFLMCARREGLRPKYCYVQSGTFLSPYWCLNSMVIPIWVSTPCYPALQFVTGFLNNYPFEIEEILLSFEPSMEDAPDFFMLSRWKQLLGDKAKKINYIGMNPSLYPHDMTSYFKYWNDLSAWGRKRIQPLDMRLTLENILEKSETVGIRYQVTEL